MASSNYDPSNRMTGQQDPTGITSGLAYDADSRMITRALSSIGTFTYAYDNANRNTKLTNPLSEVTTNTYDADSRLSTRTPTDSVGANHGYFVAYPPQLRGCEGLAKTLLHNCARTPWSDLK